MKKQEPREKNEADRAGAGKKLNDNIDPREISSRDKDYLIHELQRRQAELSMQNEELRTMHLELEESHQKYRQFYDLTPLAYVTFDREGCIRDLNLAAASLIGSEKHLLLNIPSAPLIHQNSLKRFQEHLAKVFQSGSIEKCCITMKKRDGSEFPAELRSRVEDVPGKTGFCRTAIIDNNGQLRLEHDLQEREEEFRSMFELSAVGKVQIDPQSCRFIRVNKRFCSITGYSPEELLGMTFKELVHRDDLNQGECFERALRKETPDWKDEKRYIRKDGAVIWTKITGTVQFDEAGTPYRAMAVIEDITESKNAEQALRESEERYRSLLESLPEGIFVQQAGICVYVNRAGLELLQAKDIDEVRGKKVLDFIHPDFREKAERRIRQIEEGGHVVPRELRILRLDGLELDVEAVSIPVNYGGRRAVQILIKDISDRWQSELRLRLQATVLSQVNDAVVAVGLDGRIIFWNRGAERLYKLSAEEAIGKRRESVYQYRWPTPEQDKAAKEAMASSRFLRGENVHVLWNGEKIHVESSVSLLLSWSGLPAGWLAVMRDITERKVFEEKLKESEERYRTLAENLPGIVYRVFCQENNRIQFFNKAAPDIIGYGAEELCQGGQVCSLEELLLPEDRAEVVSAVYKAVKEKKGFIVEYRLRNKKGEIRHLMEQGTPVFDGKGGVLYIDGVISDVTEHKHAEQAVKEARDAAERERQHLEIILNTIPSGVFVAEAPHGGITLQNKQARLILGRDMSDEKSATPDLMQKYAMRRNDGSYFTPEELPYLQALAGQNVTGVEMTALRPDGSVITILSNAAPIRDGNGTIIASVAAFTDITERKKAEDELKRARMELELRVKERTGELAATIDALQAEIAERRRTAAERDKLVAAVESAAEAIVVTDKNGIIQYVNPAFEQVTGYRRQEALGGNFHIFDSGQHDEDFFREMRETIRSQGVWKGRLINKKKDGTIYYEDCTYSPVKDASGNIVNYVSIKHDVTEKLRLEAIAEAVDAMNNIGYVFSGIRHEIGNPVSSLLIIMSLLKKKYETSPREAIGEYVDQAISQVERIEYLLTSLKNFNMYENLQIRSIDAASFFEKFVPLVTSDLLKKGILLDPLVQQKNCFLSADPRALQQALLNIIVNASDALEGVQNPRISLSMLRAGTMFRISVSDNGVGISEERKKDLFKPFYTTKANGTGLGLVISRKLVSRMQGFIEIASEVNKGTCVDIYLPEGSSECAIEQKKNSPGH